jgi:hypothetical protein
MAADRTKALTTPHRIKPTSTSRHSAWRPNPGRTPGRGSTYRGGDSVQTTGTSSLDTLKTIVMFCGVGLIVSVLLATNGLDIGAGFS